MRCVLYIVAALAAAPAFAQDAHRHHMPAAGADSAATAAFREINDRMHREMDIAYTGDVDVDFARGMIAHHQGAIDMARVLLEHSTDPELRSLAEAIVTAQEAEIAQMQLVLKRKGAD